MNNDAGRLVFAAAGGLLAGVALMAAFANAASPALDPPRVAPHIYEVALDNDRVRVLKVRERNGENQPLHALEDRVVVHLSPCGWLTQDDSGASAMVSHKVGAVYWADAEIRGGETREVIQDCLSLAIELKR